MLRYVQSYHFLSYTQLKQCNMLWFHHGSLVPNEAPCSLLAWGNWIILLRVNLILFVWWIGYRRSVFISRNGLFEFAETKLKHHWRRKSSLKLMRLPPAKRVRSHFTVAENGDYDVARHDWLPVPPQVQVECKIPVTNSKPEMGGRVSCTLLNLRLRRLASTLGTKDPTLIGEHCDNGVPNEQSFFAPNFVTVLSWLGTHLCKKVKNPLGNCYY